MPSRERDSHRRVNAPSSMKIIFRSCGSTGNVLPFTTSLLLLPRNNQYGIVKYTIPRKNSMAYVAAKGKVKNTFHEKGEKFWSFGSLILSPVFDPKYFQYEICILIK